MLTAAQRAAVRDAEDEDRGVGSPQPPAGVGGCAVAGGIASPRSCGRTPFRVQEPLRSHAEPQRPVRGVTDRAANHGLAIFQRSTTPANLTDVASAPDPVEPGPTPRTGPAATSLTGSIRDASGGVLPGVTVTAVNSATGFTRTTTTDSEGRYNFDYLLPGEPYRVTATLAGFRTASADLQAASGTTQRDFTIGVGPRLETVIVTAEAPAVDVQNARQGAALGQPGQTGARGGGGRAPARRGVRANMTIVGFAGRPASRRRVSLGRRRGV